jgi:hypothetical protein
MPGGMIVSHSWRFIVFSNPKTGSESLRNLLAPWNGEPVPNWRESSALYTFLLPRLTDAPI